MDGQKKNKIKKLANFLLNNPILLADYVEAEQAKANYKKSINAHFDKSIGTVFNGFLTGDIPIEQAAEIEFGKMVGRLKDSDHPQAPFQCFCFDWLLRDFHANQDDYLDQNKQSIIKRARRFRLAKKHYYESTR